jgi:hypothetical protein
MDRVVPKLGQQISTVSAWSDEGRPIDAVPPLCNPLVNSLLSCCVALGLQLGLLGVHLFILLAFAVEACTTTMDSQVSPVRCGTERRGACVLLLLHARAAKKTYIM